MAKPGSITTKHQTMTTRNLGLMENQHLSPSPAVVHHDDPGAVESEMYDEETNVTGSFPFILYRMLEDASAHGFNDIISWLPAGDGFKIYNIQAFEDGIMGNYFINQTRYKSFLRQLNFYGFDRVIGGAQKGRLHHELFQRGRPSLCHGIKRRKRKLLCRGGASRRRVLGIKPIMKGDQMHQMMKCHAKAEGASIDRCRDPFIYLSSECDVSAREHVMFSSLLSSHSDVVQQRRDTDGRDGEETGSCRPCSPDATTTIVAPASKSYQSTFDDEGAIMDAFNKIDRSLVLLDDDIASEIIATFCKYWGEDPLVADSTKTPP
jgi:hypothetical protein